MNTHDTLEHTTTDRSDLRAAEAPGSSARSPEASSPEASDVRPERKRPGLLVAGIALVAIVGTVGTIAGFANGGDSRDVAALEAQLDDARAERDAALDELDELDARSSVLEARIGALQAERDRISEELAATEGETAALENLLAELDATILTVRADLDAAVRERDAARSKITALEADLGTAREQTAQAIADRNAVTRRFPLDVEPSLDVDDVAGAYRVAWKDVFCSGPGTCGTVPPVGTASIRSTSEGYLRLELGTVVASNLFRVPGGLHAVSGSTTAVPPCDGVPRSSTVTATLSPHSWTITRDGSAQVRTWGGAVTVEAPATATCPAVLSVRGLTLTPTS